MRLKFHHVLHADDHDIVRLGVSEVLRHIAPTIKLQTFKEISVLINELQQAQADLLILECSVSWRACLALVRNVLNNYSQTQILIFTRHTNAQFLSAMIESGVHGVVLKSDGHDKFEQALRGLSLGNYYYSPGVLAAISKATPQLAEH
jgi:DNA-binding NarL/FixJ family response regulator